MLDFNLTKATSIQDFVQTALCQIRFTIQTFEAIVFLGYQADDYIQKFEASLGKGVELRNLKKLAPELLVCDVYKMCSLYTDIIYKTNCDQPTYAEPILTVLHLKQFKSCAQQYTTFLTELLVNIQPIAQLNNDECCQLLMETCKLSCS